MPDEVKPDVTTQVETKSFHVHLGESFRNDDEIKSLAKLDDLAQGYKTRGKELAELKTKVEGAVKVPTDKSTPDEVAAWEKAIGVPEKEEDYYETAADAAPVDTLLRKVLKEAKAPKAVGSAVYKALKEYGAQAEILRQDTAKKESESAVAELKKTFGDDHDRRMEAIRKTVFNGFDDKTWESFRSTKFGNDTKFMTLLSDIGLDMSEGRYIKGVGTQKSDLASRLYGGKK